MQPTIIDAIFQAFLKEEGYDPTGKSTDTDMPTRNNNPLDLRYAGQLNGHCPDCGLTWTQPMKPCTKNHGIHAVAAFQTRGAGFVAGFRQIAEWTAQGKSLRQMVNTQAPPNENNTSSYLQNVTVFIREQYADFHDVDQPILEML